MAVVLGPGWLRLVLGSWLRLGGWLAGCLVPGGGVWVWLVSLWDGGLVALRRLVRGVGGGEVGWAWAAGSQGAWPRAGGLLGFGWLRVRWES